MKLNLTTPPKDNEEFIAQLKKKNQWLTILPIIGIITMALGLYGEFAVDIMLPDKMLGVYTGFGAGLLGVAAVLILRNRQIMKDEAKLTAYRIKNSDERNQAIAGKAFSIAALVLLIAMYLGGLVGGLFYPILVDVMLYGVCLFLISYLIAWKVLDKRC